jgi:membrane fusion protein, multidrug efflux system
MRTSAIVAAVVLAMGAGAVAVVSTGAPKAVAQSPAPAGGGVPVTAGTVTAADVPVYLTGIGTVQAFNMVTVRSRVDGQIVKVEFNEGQEVKAGTPLIQIDPRPYKAALDQATATQEKDQANLTNAQLIYAREAQIIKANLAVSQQQFDTDKANVAAGQALVDSDKAQMESAKLNLDYSTIAAPIEGRLGSKLVDIGNIVHAADTSGLVTIAQLKPIFVSFTLPQTDLDAIREHQSKGDLIVRAYSGNDPTSQLSEGRLTLIDNAIDQATGTIHLKATFPNQDERLWPGEFINVRLLLDIRRGAPTVPSQTVQVGPDGSYVYVVNSQNKAERRPVDVASVQDGIAVIAKGLKAGEKVVVEGQYRLTEGATVKVEAPRQGPTG